VTKLFMRVKVVRRNYQLTIAQEIFLFFQTEKICAISDTGAA